MSLNIVTFSYLSCTKFLPDKANKTMTCYTFSVRAIIPESKKNENRTAMISINVKAKED